MYGLEEFKTEVVVSETVYIVNYFNGNFSGSCHYVSSPIRSKYQVGPIYLLTQCEMGDVIEYIHKKNPLCSEDLEKLQYHIREHSKGVLLREGIKSLLP